MKYRVAENELESRTLWLSVWHSDKLGRNDFLGEVMLPLTKEVLNDSNPGPQWYSLENRTESSLLSYKGTLTTALKYVSSSESRIGELHVLVKEAKNLIATRSNGTSDPFCKSYLLPDKSKKSKQKTPVLKKTCHPEWNCTLVYKNLTLDDLKDRCLELTIWDHDKITSNDFLGGTRLSLGTGKFLGRPVDWMDSQCEEISLWRVMLQQPGLWVERSLPLRSTMMSGKF
ncbi:synaptotagmin-like protein 4 [Limulus polyphemus]|uniref:Synaptotagmin-like protein 4 n=1 Tax=Limulus polyphemus TaxID=6850 RepID=A0ABM1BXZ4_LIMPO|nr:synaptotagmin-like protein 4 [Limulus polyphemus]